MINKIYNEKIAIILFIKWDLTIKEQEYNAGDNKYILCLEKIIQPRKMLE